MTPNEIRESNYAVTSYLREIAAQLAELNQNIKLLRPIETEVEMYASTTEAYEAEDEDLKEQKRQFQELLASPTSDPDKYVRCYQCGKEVERPEYSEIGETSICDDCIPF